MKQNIYSYRMTGDEFAAFVELSKLVKSEWKFTEGTVIKPELHFNVRIDERDREILLPASIIHGQERIAEILASEQGIEQIVTQGFVAYILKIKRLGANSIKFLFAIEAEEFKPHRSVTISFVDIRIESDADETEILLEDGLNYANFIDLVVGIDELGSDLQIVTTTRVFLFSGYRVTIGAPLY